MIPKSHPRYASLLVRERIVSGVEKGVASLHGLIAHGRGEAIDYLLGEKTRPFAQRAVEAAAAQLLLAAHPVISVNGNAAALCPKELVLLSSLLNCPLEINIFHPSTQREQAIAGYLRKHGARNVLLPQRTSVIKHLESNRKYVNSAGIFAADVVFVPLEDGDRAQALARNGKKVITVDINPLSRTAKAATVRIVDNFTRAMPLLIASIRKLKRKAPGTLQKITRAYSNKKALAQATRKIRTG